MQKIARKLNRLHSNEKLTRGLSGYGEMVISEDLYSSILVLLIFVDHQSFIHRMEKPTFISELPNWKEFGSITINPQ